MKRAVAAANYEAVFKKGVHRNCSVTLAFDLSDDHCRRRHFTPPFRVALF
jgi:hypothetical protein